MPFVRSANTGISAVIDHYGRFIGRLELEKEGVLDIYIPVSTRRTVFSIYGNMLYIIMSIFMLLLARVIFIKNKL